MDNNWGTAGNWSPAGAPTSSDDVTIGAGADVTVNVSAACRNLDLSRNLLLNTCSGPITVSGGVVLSGGATITISGACGGNALVFNGGGARSLAGSGSIVFGAGGSNATVAVTNSTALSVASGVTVRTGGTLRLEGTFSPGGTFSADNSIGLVSLNCTVNGGTLAAPPAARGGTRWSAPPPSTASPSRPAWRWTPAPGR